MKEELINNEVTNEVVETVTKRGFDFKTGVIIGGSAVVAGATLWELVIKPIGKKVAKGIRSKVAAKKAKKEAEIDDEEFFDVEDVPNID